MSDANVPRRTPMIRGARHALPWIVLAACTGPTDTDTEPPATPTEASNEQVTLDGAFPLEGVLQLPATPDGAPTAAVLLVHGSGPQSRDVAVSGQLNMSFGTEILMFKQLSKQLRDAGLAVLRYDKRTCGAFNGRCDNDYPMPDLDDITVDDFVDDAGQAATWLMDHAQVDADQVYVIGHSQGGELIPAILDANPGLAGGISLAGPWQPIDVLLDYQLQFSRQILTEAGVAPDDIDASLASLDTMVAQLQDLRDGTHDGSAIGGSPSVFWQSWMDAGDARPGLVTSASQPMAAILGDYDWNVPSDTEASGWSDAGVATEVLPCITHALNCVAEPDYTRITVDDIGTSVDTAVSEAILSALEAMRP